MHSVIEAQLICLTEASKHRFKLPHLINFVLFVSQHMTSVILFEVFSYNTWIYICTSNILHVLLYELGKGLFEESAVDKGLL